ncbi:MAG: hypothetical protein ACI9WU_001463 [Myxococcota bacterium]|jgi:hypothetical protein
MNAGRTLCQVAFLTVLLVGSTAAAQDWNHYANDDLGLSMLTPSDTRVVSEKLGPDWAGVIAKKTDGLIVYGLAQLGKKPDSKTIQAFAAKHTGIALTHWESIDTGKRKRGFEWFEAAIASHKGQSLVATWGQGPKGAYLVLLQAPTKHFEAHKEDYKVWYRNVTVR